jgi:hypothetical protein
MQKMMQKLVARNIKDETLGHVPHIYNNLPTNQGRERNHNAPHDYTYTGSSGKQEVTLELS